MLRGDWGNTTNKQMPRIGDTDSWNFCKVWPHMPCLLTQYIMNCVYFREVISTFPVAT